ncbi:dihydrofolate reductase family protein [Streptosporangium sp. CA-115845]|uniref:dihydrofolate reductase family protein n=1 Tax=Streptosporangium sp. CA-115845 TaxID=3240071 RepID=UPI003D8F3E28
MAKIVVTESVTLDGVMQGLGRMDEDTRGGFRHGGWGTPYMDSAMMEVMGRGMASTGAMLFGRRTYEDFFKVWHGRTDGNPFTEKLDNTRKYVASRTLAQPPSWQNSILLTGDVVQAVEALKKEQDHDIAVLGSGELVRSLLSAGLVDRFVLSIHPLVLGSGRRLFPDDGLLAKFRLVDSVPTGTGVVIASYEVKRE